MRWRKEGEKKRAEWATFFYPDLSILPDTGNRSNAISLKAVTSFRLSTRNKNSSVLGESIRNGRSWTGNLAGVGGGGEEEDEWKERGDAGNRRRPEIKREQPCQGRDGRIKREISNRSSCDSYFSRSMDDRESLPRKRSSNVIPRTRRGESKRLKSFVSASKVFDIRRSRARFDY